MKLELKHIAPYLPYGLKFYNTDMEVDFKLTIQEESEPNTIDLENVISMQDVYKPILRPLSDLTKEIEHNGEKFVPIEYFSEHYTDHLVRFEKPDYIILEDDYSISQNVLGAPLAIIEKLYEWHFDIYGLIENGLAIDINTLEK